MEGSLKYDQNVEAAGHAILAVTSALGEGVQPIMVKHGIVDLHAEGWYPLKAWLDVMDEISAMYDQVAMGMKIVETAVFPPGIDSIESVLNSVEIAYQMNHRGGYIGHYTVEKLGERNYKVVAQTHFPDFFTYGILYGLCREFAPPNSNLTVTHDSAPCKKDGADSCTYLVAW